MVPAPDGEAGVAAGVREDELERRQPVEDAAEDQARDRDRRVEREADEVLEVVGTAPPRCLRGGRVRVEEEQRPEALGRLEEGEQRRIVEVAPVHVRTERGAGEAQPHRALELGDRARRLLKRHGREPADTPRRLAHRPRDLVIELPGRRLGLGDGQMVVEEVRGRGEELHPDFLPIHHGEALLQRGAPQRLLRPGQPVARHDVTLPLVLALRRAVPLPASLGRAPEGLGDEVRVDVDVHGGSAQRRVSGGGEPTPSPGTAAASRRGHGVAGLPGRPSRRRPWVRTTRRLPRRPRGGS